MVRERREAARERLTAEDGGDQQGEARGPSVLVLSVIGANCALLIANLYYAQPLIGEIAADLGISPALAGATITAVQFGYGAGLLLLVPLADMMANRKLVLFCGAVVIAASAALSLVQNLPAFLILSTLAGIFSAAAQVLIPYVTHLIGPGQRGRVIGAMMSGILVSVMLARPFALVVADIFGWRAIYLMSAAATCVTVLALAVLMPERTPERRLSYGQTLSTAWTLYRGEPRVIRRTMYQALLFAVFCMFWAVAPVMLADLFLMSKSGIALFTLAGVGGVLAAPVAGRLSDRGFEQGATIFACILVVLACGASSIAAALLLFPVMIMVAVCFDAAIQASQTISRLVVLDVAQDSRGRINAMYMTIVYMSGAAGSLFGVFLYSRCGWNAVALAAASAAGLIALAAAKDTAASQG
jgi:predicted MFS family arabinose efflux permease